MESEAKQRQTQWKGEMRYVFFHIRCRYTKRSHSATRSAAHDRVQRKNAKNKKKLTYQKKTRKQHVEHGPQKHKKRAKIIKKWGPDGPGELPGEPREPFWSPKLPRAEKRRQNESPWLPQPPQKGPKSYDFRMFLLLFYMYFSRHVFLMLPASFFMVLGSKIKGKSVRRGDFLESCFHANFWYVLL